MLLEDDDGNELEVEIPLRWEICDECRGEGKHSRAIDGNGITSSEWAEWEPEEREAYFAGRYDRPCQECRGTGKVQVPDYDSLDSETLKLVEAKERSDADYEAMCRLERKMGC